jgi:signal transduction histidine kinase
MWNFVIDLFGSPFWEPHGHCFLWTPSLLWTMVAANLLICLAYYSIPLTLFTLVRKRADLVHRQVFVLFAIFIFACGTTHLVKVWTLWTPVYWLQGAIDGWTALVSVITAIVLWPLLPQILALPSPLQLQTANQALQAQIRAHQQTEDALQERTRELEKANRALAAANRELEAFAYSTSHDLKGPLRAINHLATWIREDAVDVLPQRSKEHLVKLQGRVQRLDTLLDDLLAYSRAGRQQHTLERTDTTALVRAIVAMLTIPPGFVVQILEPLPTINTERVPLETVLRNLISNAVKHHHQPAQGQVTIAAQEQEDFVEFTVADNGPGIEQEYHQRIFGLFQTLAPRDKVEGSGLGLAIVKRLVEDRGGTIVLISAPRQGATFRFTWPKGS